MTSDERIYKRIEILLEIPETNATSSGRGGDVLDPGGGRGDPGDGDNGGFGFVLRGGVHRDPARCRPLTISRVIPRSQADKYECVSFNVCRNIAMNRNLNSFLPQRLARKKLK